MVLSTNASRVFWWENTKLEINHCVKVGETIRLGQAPWVSFHVQKVQGCGFIYLRNTTVLSVGTAVFKLEVGEHNTGGTTESQAWKTGPQSLTCPLWTPLPVNSRPLVPDRKEGGSFWWRQHLLPIPHPGGGNCFLPLLISGLSHSPHYFVISLFSPSLSTTNSLHKISSPTVWVQFSWLIYTNIGGYEQKTKDPVAGGALLLC